MASVEAHVTFSSPDENARAGETAPKFQHQPTLATPRVELNPPARVALSKLPDSFYTPRLFTTKISDHEKEIGFYYC